MGISPQEFFGTGAPPQGGSAPPSGMTPEAFFGVPLAGPKAKTPSKPLVSDAAMKDFGGKFFDSMDLLIGHPPGTSAKLAKNAATVGDMFLGIPGALAGDIGGQVLKTASALDGTSQPAAEKGSLEYRNMIAEKGNPQWFSRLVRKLDPPAPGKTEDPTVVSKAMDWVGKVAKLAVKGQALSRGEMISDEEAESRADWVMDALGAKGAGRLAGKPRAPGEPLTGANFEKEAPPAGPPAGPALEGSPGARPPGGKPTNLVFNKETGVWEPEEAQKALGGPEVPRLAAPEGKTAMSKAKQISLGAGAAGVAAYGVASDEHKDAILATAGGILMLGKGEMSLEDLARVHPESTMGDLRDSQPYTTKTFQRLNPKATSFTKSYLEQELKRADVTDAERGAIRAAMAEAPGDRVSAKDLLLGFRKATGDFELKAKETDEYADYGLEQIGRHSESDMDYDELQMADPAEVAAARAAAPQPTTTLYRLPEHMELSDANHFSDPNLFGWTRSFEEDGVRHVVEIQSDLAQHAKGGATSEEIPALRSEYEAIDAKRAVYAELMDDASTPGENSRILQQLNAMPEFADSWRRGENNAVEIIRREDRRLEVRAQELLTKLKASAVNSQISPIIKNWPKRLVREELAKASRQRGVPADGDAEVVRFATADTVAKVEGWPDSGEARRTQIADAQERLTSHQAHVETLEAIKRGEVPKDEYYSALKVADPEAYERVVRHIDAELGYARESLREAQAQFDRTSSTWGYQTRFRPEHQSIYDRYKKDIEKFLNQLGGKPYTDPHGHTWIEVPVPKKGPTQMFGRADTKALLGIAAVGLGLVAGANLDPKNPIEGAILGAIAGAALVTGAVPAAHRTFREIAMPDPRIRINQYTEALEHSDARVARSVFQVQRAVTQLLPKRADREAVTVAIDEGKVSGLKGNQAKAAALLQKFYADAAAAGKAHGVLDITIQDYTTHILGKRGGQSATLGGGGPGAGPSTRFAKTRHFKTLREAEAAGFPVLTRDAAEIVGIYGNSLGRAIGRKVFIDNLKAARGPQGERLVATIAKAPGDYVPIGHPAFKYLHVHPDIAPSLSFLFEAQHPGAIMSGLGIVNTALKRSLLSFSLFHAKALLDVAFGAMNNPGIALRIAGQAALPRLFGVDTYLKMLREGGQGDAVDLALGAGLKISYEMGEAGTSDLSTPGGGGFYNGFRGLQNMLDRAVTVGPVGLGRSTVGVVAKVSHMVDNFTWGRLFTPLKLNVFLANTEALMKNTAGDPHPLTQKEAARIAAEYTNTAFGGLNWQRAAEALKTRWGRDFGLEMFSPKGVRAMQLLTLAPDWLLSTTLAFTRALTRDIKRPDTMVKGLFKAKTSGDLYRRQLVRSMLWFALFNEALTYYHTGHHFWKSEDPTRVDLGDGRTMQLSKHFTEPVHLTENPAQTALNKLGIIPKEAAEQILGKEYLSAKGQAPAMDTSPMGRVKHALGEANPIGLQQFRDAGSAAGASGMVGFPIYGQTAEQKRTAALQKALDDYNKRMAEAAKK